MKTRSFIIIAGLAIMTLFCVQALAQEQYSITPYQLTIIETSDIHGAFSPYDFKTDQPKTSSLSQAATLIKAERDKNPNVLLLDGGDNLQGQPIVYFYNFVKTDSMNAFSEMMNYLDYDAVTVGNHDVETGHAVYDKVRNELNMPLLSANLVNKSDGKPYFQPYAVFTKGGVKIAVMGLTSPGFRKNFPEILYSGIKIVDMVEAAKKWAPIIMEKEKPDLLIGLFHSGVDYKYAKGEDANTPLNENAAQIVAEQVPGFDLVLVAHDHQGWEGTGLNKAQVMGPNANIVPIFGPVDECKKIPVINITMKWNSNNKTWEKKIEGKLVATNASVPADSAMLKTFDEEFQLVKTWVSKPLGKMDGVMKASDSMFGDSSFVDMIHTLQLDITENPENGLKPALISFCAPLDANAVVPSSKDGTIYVRDMFSLYRYENWMYTMTLYGRQIKGFLEASYEGWFDTMKGPQDHLIAFQMKDGKLDLDARTNMPRTKVATYNYDSAAGIIYSVDVSKPSGSRIIIESLANGDPFVMDKIYTVAINSYRAMGGGGLLEKGAGISAADLLSMKYVTSATTRDLRYYLTEWFESQNMKTITPQALNTWKIIPEDWAAAGKALDYPLLYPPKK